MKGLAAAILVLVAAAGTAGAGEADMRHDWLVEMKRQNTGRGTEDESTRTQVKVERRLEGPFAFARLELPFPDEDTDFEGSLFRPRLGDVKTRLAFAPVEVAGRRFTSYVELAFPTADPESLGTGKYVWQAGGGWAFAALAGASLWGEGVAGTYDRRVEFKVSRRL